MDPKDFCIWLQGYLEALDDVGLDVKKTDTVKSKLAGVFEHVIDKQYKKGDGSQEVHDGKKLTKISTSMGQPRC